MVVPKGMDWKGTRRDQGGWDGKGHVSPNNRDGVGPVDDHRA